MFTEVHREYCLEVILYPVSTQDIIEYFINDAKRMLVVVVVAPSQVINVVGLGLRYTSTISFISLCRLQELSLIHI